jgi:invasion associated locus B (IalB) protein
MRELVLACLAGAVLAAPAAGADKFLGRFEKWEAHRGGDGNDAYCFIAALPAKSEGKIAKRGEATLMIAHFPKRKSFGQVQVKAGFALKKGAKLELAVGTKVFKLAADGDAAYGENSKENGEILAALKAGKTAAATGLPGTGAKIVDTYPLDGFAKALAAIDKECGRK